MIMSQVQYQVCSTFKEDYKSLGYKKGKKLQNRKPTTYTLTMKENKYTIGCIRYKSCRCNFSFEYLLSFRRLLKLSIVIAL